MSTADSVQKGPQDLVVIGSSAGGIGALSVIVGLLPVDFPAPIVLAQHLDPNRPSNLGALLSRRTALPVVVVEENAPLEAGKIYVVPANRHVSIVDAHLHLDSDHEYRPRPSVDRLLSTAAESYGENLIAVVLSGSGSDGAAGAVEVKNAGGVVIIQNPETAQYPSMPSSLPPTAVDHVANIEQIAPLLYDLVKGARMPFEEKVDDPLRELLEIVSRQTSIDFRPYKPSTILRRVERRMALTHNPTIRDYSTFLETHAGEVQELVKVFLIRVTGFFRDPEAFEFLRDQVLQDLIAKARLNERVLRFWSAGCATGEEPYSLAILLADLLGSELPEWNIKIFATDLDEGAINFARRGLYPENALQNLPEEYRNRFFEPQNNGYRITKRLRQVVIFGNQDISRGSPFPRINLVMCRNLLIYFKPELQQTVLDLFAYSLQQSNGYLFLGKAETTRPSKGSFELLNKKWKIYKCVRGPIVLPPREGMLRLKDETAYSDRVAVARRLAIGERGSMTAQDPDAASELEFAHLRRFSEVMMRYLPIGVVVIDSSYRIVTVNATARRLLGIRDRGTEQDFLHSAKALPYAQVRGAIDTAFRERTAVTLEEVELEGSTGGEGRYCNLSILLMQFEPGFHNLATVTVSDTTEQVELSRRLAAMESEHTQLIGELSSANKRQGDINSELQEANEELQAANEELMLTQEEMQATNEEFEATNEELQATNEELETNNEELQATNEELQTTNDELSARTNELQEVTKLVSNERRRLTEMVEHLPQSILILSGPNLTVEAYNSKFALLIQGREVLGRPFDELFEGSDMAAFVEMVRESYRKDLSSETPQMLAHVRDERGDRVEQLFIHTITPIHDSTGKVDGIMIYTERAPSHDGSGEA